MPHRKVPGSAAASGPAAPARPTAVVIGGGMAGLVAAAELSDGGYAVTVLEKTGRFGGCVARHEVASLVLDAGAESFATRSPAVAGLAAALGLGEKITAPNPAGAWLQLPADPLREGAVTLPKTGILGIPADPQAPEVVRAIGKAGARRAAMDRFLPLGTLAKKESVSLAELVRTRMGERVLTRLVTPIAAGVLSAAPEVLDADAAAPGLRAALATHGSLAAAVAALRTAAPAGSAVAGLEGGMFQLADALVDKLTRAGAVLRPGTAATALRQGPGGWQVDWRPADADTADSATADSATADSAESAPIEADLLILAVDASAVGPLLGAVLPEVALHKPQPGPAVELLTLVVDLPELDAAPRGTGVLVAAGTEGVMAKALTHATAKWPWLASAAGPGCHVLRLSYGRAAGTAADSKVHGDGELYAQALADASALLDLPVRHEDVIGWDVVRWVGALPAATVGHAGRVAAIRTAAAGLEGLELVGAWLAGTGLAAVVSDTTRRTRDLMARHRA